MQSIVNQSNGKTIKILFVHSQSKSTFETQIQEEFYTGDIFIFYYDWQNIQDIGLDQNTLLNDTIEKYKNTNDNNEICNINIKVYNNNFFSSFDNCVSRDFTLIQQVLLWFNLQIDKTDRDNFKFYVELVNVDSIFYALLTEMYRSLIKYFLDFSIDIQCLYTYIGISFSEAPIQPNEEIELIIFSHDQEYKIIGESGIFDIDSNIFSFFYIYPETLKEKYKYLLKNVTLQNAIIYNYDLITNYSDVVSIMAPSTFVLSLDVNEMTYDEIISTITQLQMVHSYIKLTDLIVFQHKDYANGSSYYALTDKHEHLLNHVRQLDRDLISWNSFITFLERLQNECHIKTLSLLQCKLYTDPNWIYVIKTILAKNTLEGFQILSSDDNTGHVIFDGDWTLERNKEGNEIHFEMIDKYFISDAQNTVLSLNASNAKNAIVVMDASQNLFYCGNNDTRRFGNNLNEYNYFRPLSLPTFDNQDERVKIFTYSEYFTLVVTNFNNIWGIGTNINYNMTSQFSLNVVKSIFNKLTLHTGFIGEEDIIHIENHQSECTGVILSNNELWMWGRVKDDAGNILINPESVSSINNQNLIPIPTRVQGPFNEPDIESFKIYSGLCILTKQKTFYTLKGYNNWLKIVSSDFNPGETLSFLGSGYFGGISNQNRLFYYGNNSHYMSGDEGQITSLDNEFNELTHIPLDTIGMDADEYPTQVCSQWGATYMITNKQNLFNVGHNNNGQRGNGINNKTNNSLKRKWMKITTNNTGETLINRVKCVIPTIRASYIITTDGFVMSTGGNSSGRLGVGLRIPTHISNKVTISKYRKGIDENSEFLQNIKYSLNSVFIDEIVPMQYVSNFTLLNKELLLNEKIAMNDVKKIQISYGVYIFTNVPEEYPLVLLNSDISDAVHYDGSVFAGHVAHPEISGIDLPAYSGTFHVYVYDSFTDGSLNLYSPANSGTYFGTQNKFSFSESVVKKQIASSAVSNGEDVSNEIISYIDFDGSFNFQFVPNFDKNIRNLLINPQKYYTINQGFFYLLQNSFTNFSIGVDTSIAGEIIIRDKENNPSNSFTLTHNGTSYTFFKNDIVIYSNHTPVYIDVFVYDSIKDTIHKLGENSYLFSVIQPSNSLITETYGMPQYVPVKYHNNFYYGALDTLTFYSGSSDLDVYEPYRGYSIKKGITYVFEFPSDLSHQSFSIVPNINTLNEPDYTCRGYDIDTDKIIAIDNTFRTFYKNKLFLQIDKDISYEEIRFTIYDSSLNDYGTYNRLGFSSSSNISTTLKTDVSNSVVLNNDSYNLYFSQFKNINQATATGYVPGTIKIIRTRHQKYSGGYKYGYAGTASTPDSFSAYNYVGNWNPEKRKTEAYITAHVFITDPAEAGNYRFGMKTQPQNYGSVFIMEGNYALHELHKNNFREGIQHIINAGEVTNIDYNSSRAVQGVFRWSTTDNFLTYTRNKYPGCSIYTAIDCPKGQSKFATINFEVNKLYSIFIYACKNYNSDSNSLNKFDFNVVKGTSNPPLTIRGGFDHYVFNDTATPAPTIFSGLYDNVSQDTYYRNSLSNYTLIPHLTSSDLQQQTTGTFYLNQNIKMIIGKPYTLKNIPPYYPITINNQGFENIITIQGDSDKTIIHNLADVSYNFYYGDVTIYVRSPISIENNIWFFTSYYEPENENPFTILGNEGCRIFTDTTTEFVLKRKSKAQFIFNNEVGYNSLMLNNIQYIIEGVKFIAYPGTYAIYNIPASSAIAIENSTIQEYVTFDGLYKKKSALGPDGNTYDFFYDTLYIYIKPNIPNNTFISIINDEIGYLSSSNIIQILNDSASSVMDPSLSFLVTNSVSFDPTQYYTSQCLKRVNSIVSRFDATLGNITEINNESFLSQKIYGVSIDTYTFDISNGVYIAFLNTDVSDCIQYGSASPSLVKNSVYNTNYLDVPFFTGSVVVTIRKPFSGIIAIEHYNNSNVTDNNITGIFYDDICPLDGVNDQPPYIIEECLDANSTFQQDTENNIILNNNFEFDESVIFGVYIGIYSITDISNGAGFAVLNADISDIVEYTGETMIGKKYVSGQLYDFYTDSLNIIIKGDFSSRLIDVENDNERFLDIIVYDDNIVKPLLNRIRFSDECSSKIITEQNVYYTCLPQDSVVTMDESSNIVLKNDNINFYNSSSSKYHFHAVNKVVYNFSNPQKQFIAFSNTDVSNIVLYDNANNQESVETQVFMFADTSYTFFKSDIKLTIQDNFQVDSTQTPLRLILFDVSENVVRFSEPIVFRTECVDIDNEGPIIQLSSTDLTPTSKSANQTITLDIKIANEVTTDISSVSFTIVNGTLSNFTQQSNSHFTADLKNDNTAQDTIIYVDQGLVLDNYGNANMKSNILSWRYDNEPLTCVISHNPFTTSAPVIVNNSTTDQTIIGIQIQFSEEITNFSDAYISLTNCVITSRDENEDGTTILYTLRNDVTASSMTFQVLGGTFTTINNIQKTLTSSSLNWNYASSFPSVNLTVLNSTKTPYYTVTNEPSIDISLVFTEPVIENTITADIFTIEGDSLTVIDISRISTTEYTSKIGISAEQLPNELTGYIYVEPSRFLNINSISNEEFSNVITYEYFNVDIFVEISSPVYTSGQILTGTMNSIELEIRVSEPIISISDESIVINNGNLISVYGSGLIYYIEVEAINNQAIEIFVPSNSIFDENNNTNSTQSNTFTWQYLGSSIQTEMIPLNFENQQRLDVSSVEIKLVFSEDVSNQVISDHFYLSNVQIISIMDIDFQTWIVNATHILPNIQSIISYKESQNIGFVYENTNVSSNTIQWIYDNISPELSINSTDVLYNGNSNQTEFVLSITGNKDISGLELSDISHNENVVLEQLSVVNSYTYNLHVSVKFGILSGVLSLFVQQNSVVDIFGRSNIENSNIFQWNYDTTGPDIVLDSADVSFNGNVGYGFVEFFIQSDSLLGKKTRFNSFVINNGNIASFNRELNTFKVVSNNPNADVSMEIIIPPGSVFEQAGNANTEQILFSFTMLEDTHFLYPIFARNGISRVNYPKRLDIENILDQTTFFSRNVSNLSNKSKLKRQVDNRNAKKIIIDYLLSYKNINSTFYEKDDVPFTTRALSKVANKSIINVVKSNQQIRFLDFVVGSLLDTVVYCPVSDISDTIEIELINGEFQPDIYKISKTSIQNYDLYKNESLIGNFSDDEFYRTENNYEIVFGSGTVYYDGSVNDSVSIPCFMKGTKILTQYGYKSIELLIPGMDILINDKNEQIPLRNIEKYIKKYDGIEFPYIVPEGVVLSPEFICNQSLRLTYNHGIYVPHLNKYVPSSRLNLRQDKTKVEYYEYYHIFTDNFFSDVIIANGIPCETHGRVVKEYIRSLDSSGKLMKKILEFCKAENDGTRNRIKYKDFRKICSKYSKNNTKYKNGNMKKGKYSN